MREADGQGGGALPPVLPAAKAGVDVRGLQREDLGEGVAHSQGAHLGRGVPGGVHAANQRAHAGSGDAVDGDVIIFKPLNHAHVGQAECSAAFKSQADCRPVGGDYRGQRGLRRRCLASGLLRAGGRS